MDHKFAILTIVCCGLSVHASMKSARAKETKVPVTFSGGHELGKNDYGRPINLMAAGLA